MTDYYSLRSTGHDLRWTQNGEPCHPCRRCEAEECLVDNTGRLYPFCEDCGRSVRFYALVVAARSERQREGLAERTATTTQTAKR